MKTCQILVVLSLILFISCKKEKQSFTEVSGTVYDKGTNKRITAGNAKVFFEWRKPLTYGARTYHLDSNLKDARGRYSISAETPDEYSYVYANGRQHFPESAVTMGPNAQRGRKQTRNLEIIPFAWVRINIKNTGAFDYMRVNTLPGGSLPFLIFSDTVLISRAFGNTEVMVPTFKYLDINPTPTPYFIQTIERDTVDISIEF